MDYEILDISGDVGIRAFGAGAAEAFIHAASGMYSLVADAGCVEELRRLDIRVEGDSPEGLLVGFLNELIFHFDAYGFVGGRIEIEELRLDEPAIVRAAVYGEEFDGARHERRLLLKAATYHNIVVTEEEGVWRLEVIFDI